MQSSRCDLFPFRTRFGALACSRVALPPAAPPSAAPSADFIRPVKTMIVAAGEDTQTHIFPGIVEASRRVELAFQVPGLVVKLPVRRRSKGCQG